MECQSWTATSSHSLERKKGPCKYFFYMAPDLYNFFSSFFLKGEVFCYIYNRSPSTISLNLCKGMLKHF